MVAAGAVTGGWAVLPQGIVARGGAVAVGLVAGGRVPALSAGAVAGGELFTPGLYADLSLAASLLYIATVVDGPSATGMVSDLLSTAVAVSDSPRTAVIAEDELNA
jgi:hypothetical protein